MPEPASGPTPLNERLVALDVLRGVALLGILVMNIRGFAMVSAAYMNPLAQGPLDGLDHAVWLLGQVFADQKFMALFSMLFGAGVVLMYERRDAAGQRSAGLHYRRMAGLLAVGLLHAYVLWFGDILVTYALCGLWLFPLRKLRAGWLLGLGFALLVIGSGINALLGLSLPHWPADAAAEMDLMFRPTAEVLAHETAAYRGGWGQQMAYRGPQALEMQTFFFGMWGVWRAGGVMLMGMGLLKLGVLRATASTRAYVALGAAGFALGLPLIALDLWRYPAGARGTAEAFFLGTLGNYWGSLGVALGYVCVVMLVVRGGTLARLTQRLAAVGRMALTNYLAQSLVGHLLFYGTLGVGLFGRLGWAEQLGVVAAVWAAQLAWSPWWLRRHPMGPIEALWRRISYGKQPKSPTATPPSP